MIGLNCSVSHWVLKNVIFFSALERRAFLSSSNILNCIKKWVLSSPWVAWHLRHIRLATGLFGLVCFLFLFLNYWSWGEAEPPQRLVLCQSDHSHMQRVSERKRKCCLFCWFWHDLFSVQSSINLSSVCWITLFMICLSDPSFYRLCTWTQIQFKN